MMPRLPIVLFTLALSGCLDKPGDSDRAGTSSRESGATTSRPSGDSSKISAPDRHNEEDYEYFGDGIAAKGEDITVASLVGRTDELAGKKIRLTGKIEAVCKHKGCWMIVADGDKKVRIKFRDYGFFVPKDCEGREVVLEGIYSVSKTSVEELKHLLEDEGKKEEAAKVTEPKLEMKVMADGVALKKADVAAKKG